MGYWTDDVSRKRTNMDRNIEQNIEKSIKQKNGESIKWSILNWMEVFKTNIKLQNGNLRNYFINQNCLYHIYIVQINKKLSHVQLLVIDTCNIYIINQILHKS